MSEVKREKMEAILVPTEKSRIKWVPKGEWDGKEYIKNDHLLHVGVPTQYGYPSREIHIISKEYIKKGDFFADAVWQMVKKAEVNLGVDYPNGNFKVVASTDKSLGLPSPSREFIEAYIKAYNAGSPITEVMVEIEPYDIKYFNLPPNVKLGPFNFEKPPVRDCKFRPKVNKNNEIAISRVEETWDDVIDNFTENNYDTDILTMVDWLKKNYSVPTKLTKS